MYGQIGKGVGTVLIGGGTGYIGSALARRLKQLDYNVLIVSRKPGPYCITWEKLSKDGLPDCQAVVNVAGQNVLDPTRRWTPGFKQNVWASRINTTKALSEAITNSKKPPEVFVSMSGVGYYKPSLTNEYTEDSPGGDFDFLSKLCTDWEAANCVPKAKNVRRVILRSGVVLGRQGGMIKQTFLPFYFGLGGPVGTGEQFMPWIHIEDTVGIIIYFIQTKNLEGVFNGVAPQIITNAEFSKEFGKALWRPAVIPLPLKIVNFAFSEERAKMITEGQKVIPKRVLESKYKYKYPDIKSACKEFSHLFYSNKK